MQTTSFFWVAVMCAIIAQIAIVAAAARKPRIGRSVASIPVPHRAAEVAWALMPAAMLALVLMLTWNAIRLAETRQTQTGTVVELRETTGS